MMRASRTPTCHLDSCPPLSRLPGAQAVDAACRAGGCQRRAEADARASARPVGAAAAAGRPRPHLFAARPGQRQVRHPAGWLPRLSHGTAAALGAALRSQGGPRVQRHGPPSPSCPRPCAGPRRRRGASEPACRPKAAATRRLEAQRTVPRRSALRGRWGAAGEVLCGSEVGTWLPPACSCGEMAAVWRGGSAPLSRASRQPLHKRKKWKAPPAGRAQRRSCSPGALSWLRPRQSRRLVPCSW